MRVKNMVNKRECLDCLFREINILTECRHPNIIKILDASFDGMIIKEQRGVLGSGSGETDRAEQQNSMFGSQQQQTSEVGSPQMQLQPASNAHGETGGHADKVNDGTAELSIVEQVDNSSGVGIYYDEVDDMHLAQEAMNQQQRNNVDAMGYQNK